jgi:hypothetical protein
MHGAQRWLERDRDALVPMTPTASASHLAGPPPIEYEIRLVETGPLFDELAVGWQIEAEPAAPRVVPAFGKSYE